MFVTALLLSLVAACGKDVPSLAAMEKIKTEACACKDKACADKVEKKADGVLTDEAIKKHGDKGMEVAFGIAMCIARYQAK
jgi:hypothetical protein